MNGMRTWHLPPLWGLLHIIFSVAQSQDTRSVRACGEYQFQCTSGQCVSDYLQCDGAEDCEDGSDESFYLCRKLDLKCSPSSFRCAYGACVDGDAKCNGIMNCADNSDELHPDCSKNNIDPALKNLRCDALYDFACLSGECVDAVAVCDGHIDCKDGSDETLTQCFHITCQPNSFQCAYGGCIDGDKACNLEKDCLDGTDELPEYCHPPPRKGPTVIDSDSEGCLLPVQPIHGSYAIGGCEEGDSHPLCKTDPGREVQPWTVLEYACHRGYVLPVDEGSTLSESTCIETVGSPSWNQNITCRKMCEPVFSETLDLKCKYDREVVPCDQYARPDTILEPRCKPLYHALEPVKAYRETICMDNGQWRDPLFKCIPDCGKAGNPAYANKIAYGVSAYLGEHPWAIGLYRNDSSIDASNTTPKLVCGGTIISHNLVLTAAHCIFDEETGEVVNASRFEIVSGKLNISWDSQEPYQQKIGVSELTWPAFYKGRTNKFEKDIAVLVLVRSIKFSEITMPACVDWKKKGIIHTGDSGHVAGWGNDETNHPSVTLQSAIFRYTDLDTCRNDLQRNDIQTSFTEYITFDKFCAGTSEDYEYTYTKRITSVQPGDSGGGLTFVRNNQHFLFGILSNHLDSDNNFAIYTNVTDYIDWLIVHHFADTLI